MTSLPRPKLKKPKKPKKLAKPKLRYVVWLNLSNRDFRELWEQLEHAQSRGKKTISLKTSKLDKLLQDYSKLCQGLDRTDVRHEEKE